MPMDLSQTFCIVYRHWIAQTFIKANLYWRICSLRMWGLKKKGGTPIGRRGGRTVGLASMWYDVIQYNEHIRHARIGRSALGRIYPVIRLATK